MQVGTEVIINTGKNKGIQATVFNVNVFTGHVDVSWKQNGKLFVKEYNKKSLKSTTESK